MLRHLRRRQSTIRFLEGTPSTLFFLDADIGAAAIAQGQNTPPSVAASPGSTSQALAILLLAAAGPARVDRTTEVGKKRLEACNDSLVPATEEGEHSDASPPMPLE